MMKRKLLALALAVVLCLSLIPGGALAVETTLGAADLEFWLREDGEAWVEGLADETATGTLVIPDKVTLNAQGEYDPNGEEYYVTGIGFGAFMGCTGLTSVTIPDSVTSIGWNAFNGCISLTSVNIPKGVTEIGYNVFYGCSSLSSITIPEGVTYIWPEAFMDCTSLTDVSIPSSVDVIGLGAFSQTPWLERLGEFAIVNSILLSYQGNGGDVVIPEGVTCISGASFAGCTDVTSVTFPDSVTDIGMDAFIGCTGLTSVVIPNGVTCIHDEAFGNCTGLTSVTIPEGVTRIGIMVFCGCSSLTNVTIPASVTAIELAAFNGCTSLTSVKVLSETTEYYDLEGPVFGYCPNLTIYGHAGSTTEAHCKEYGIPFDLLENAPEEPDEPDTPTGPVAVTGVKLDKTSTTVSVGKVATLTATVTPADATDKGVYWTSDNTDVVMVDASGKVTGVKEGEANVTVTTVDGGFTATCAVTVTKAAGGGPSSGGSGSKPSTPTTPVEEEKPAETEKPVTPASEVYGDVVKGSWYEEGVTYVTNKGLFQGMAEGVFAPNTNMTRAMVMTVLARLDGENTEDVAVGAPWYTRAMNWAMKQGISDGTRPNDSVTREQLVAMLYRYAGEPEGSSYLTVFRDSEKVSDWAQAAMEWAVSQGIMTGKDGGRLDPQGTATRAEVAAIFQRFLEKTEQ